MRIRARVVVMLATMLTAGCSELTQVSAPDVVQPGALENPNGALVIRAGAISDFANAYSWQVLTSGLISDELFDVSSLYIIDRRVVTAGGNGYPFQQIGQARIDALTAIPALRRFDPTPSGRIAELFALLGYLEVFLAENGCSGIPLGGVDNGQPVYGPPLSRSDLLRHALSDFDTAAAQAGDSVLITQLALVGRARVLLDSGDALAAASVASTVPAGFEYQISYSTTASNQYNYAYFPGLFAEESISNDEGINGLDFSSGSDPRVPVTQFAVAPDGTTPLYADANITSLGSPMTLASGTEAQLILAESALRQGNVSTWSATLNALRGAAGMPLLGADSTTLAPPELRVDVMFRERAFWLFLTGHRHGDLRRLIRQYGRATEHVFPTGPYEGGPSKYGTDVSFVPTAESSNPQFTGCIDRAP